MKTILVNESNLNSIQQTAPACVIALGFFDGVHIGHQKVIETAKAEAKRRGLPLALMSFATHPINVLSKGERKVGNLMTLCTKKEKLKQLGVELFYLVDFTKGFANLTPDEFVKEYLVELGVKHSVAGFDYYYGNMGAGKLIDIPTYSNNQISVTEVDCVDFEGEKVSSTAIRQRLQKGLVHEIPNFLGHHYHSKAEVDKRNITILEDTMLPINGQYRAVLIQDEKRVRVDLNVNRYGVVQCLQSPKLQGPVFIDWLDYITPLQKTNII